MKLPALTVAALALLLSTGGALTGRAQLLADLRGDYDTPSSPHTNGQSSVGRIPDTFGTGAWNLYARSTAAPGGTESLLLYSTSADGVRTANAYAFPSGVYSLPAVSNTQLISGDGEGAPAANELAVHPGDTSTPQSFVVFRWTPGVGEVGTLLLNGALRDLGAVGNGLTFQIFDQAGASLYGSATTSGNTPLSFNFNATIPAGGFLDFVVGNNGSFNADQSALSVTITAVPEPATAAAGLACCGALFVAWRRSARKAPVGTR